LTYRPCKILAFALAAETAEYPDGNFKGAMYEQHQNYDIAWFVWDTDGSMPEMIIEDDWEPLILFWRGTELVKVTVRRHYVWRDFFADAKLGDAFSTPLQVIFEGTHHGPRVRTLEGAASFDEDASDKDYYGELRHNYMSIQREKTPDYAQKTTLSVDGAWIRLNKSVHDIAQQEVKELEL
jgi:hypothetical protein